MLIDEILVVVINSLCKNLIFVLDLDFSELCRDFVLYVKPDWIEQSLLACLRSVIYQESIPLLVKLLPSYHSIQLFCANLVELCVFVV